MVEPIMPAVTLLAIVLAGFVIWAVLSPFEALGWWAGWFGDAIHDEDIPSDGLVRTVPPDADSYVIFLSGVSRVSGETLSRREQGFLRRLAKARRHSVIIDDIFPYSVNNLALTGHRLFAHLWRFAVRCKLDGPHLAGYLVNVRNMLQIAMSGDHRYGPIYNQATAQVLYHGLLRYEYPMDGTPVFVVGYSGGGQMAVGAVTYLVEKIQAPVYVISLGGLFASDPGLLAAEHLYHLYGTADRTHRLAAMVPGRWPFFVTSEWNQARRRQKISFVCLGPMRHTGKRGYLDQDSRLPDGTPFVDRTVRAMADIIAGAARRPQQVGSTVLPELAWGQQEVGFGVQASGEASA